MFDICQTTVGALVRHGPQHGEVLGSNLDVYFRRKKTLSYEARGMPRKKKKSSL